MESRSEHSPPEQGWNAKYYTPEPPGKQANTEAATQDHSASPGTISPLCLRVREGLDELLDNNGSVRPEAASALYGHVAVCPGCAREFEAMQRVVNMLEAMPLAELPADYSRLVMRRIQTGQAPLIEASTVQSVGLCDRVREKLHPLLENDPAIRPEMATALYGHLAVCAECSTEFAAMQRMVNLLETMPSMELPIDYAPHIMRRIQTDGMVVVPAKEQAAPGPTFAASSLVSGEVAIHNKRVVTRQVALTETGVSGLSYRQRMIVSVGLAGMFVYLLASDWGRQMLGVNLEAARTWLAQIGNHLERVPVLGALIIGIGAALSSVSEALGQTFSTLGGMAAQTLALELAIGFAACLVIASRRQSTYDGI